MASALQQCGSSCPAGYHITSRSCNLNCGGCGTFGDIPNQVKCEPNIGATFDQCGGGGSSCPAGYHITAYSCNSACGSCGVFGTLQNQSTCAFNTELFNQCGLGCPANYSNQGQSFNSVCRPDTTAGSTSANQTSCRWLGASITVSSAGVGLGNGSLVNLGSTNVNVALDRVFTIRNAGGQTLSVSVTASGTGYQLLPSPPTSIVAGASASFTIRLLSGSSGTFSGQITIGNNDPDDNPFRVNLTGQVNSVAPRMALTDSTLGVAVSNGGSVSFGTTPIGAAVDHTFTIRNDGNAALGVSMPVVSGSAEFMLVTAPPSSIPAFGGTGTFTLRFRATTANSHSAQVSIGNSDATNNPFRLTVSGTAQIVSVARLQIDNYPTGSTFDLGATPVGAPVARTLTLRNIGNITLNLSSVWLGDIGNFSLTGPGTTTLAPGATTTLTVQYNARAVGAATTQLTIGSNDAASPYRVTVQGTGTGPRIEVSATCNAAHGATCQYPSTTAGVGTFIIFTLRNTGNQALSILNPGSILSGTGFQLTIAPPSSVAIGGSANFRIRLLAANPGTYTGTVNIQSNDPVRNPYTFAVQGTVTSGAQPRVRVVSGNGVTLSDGATYTMPSTIAGTPISRAFTIYNDGDATLFLTNPTSLVSGAGFSQIDTAPASSIPAQGSTSFRVRLHAATPGTYTGMVTIQSNDPASPFDIILRGTVN